VKCSLKDNRDVIRVRGFEHDVVELVEPYNVATWEMTWERSRDSARVQAYDFPVAAFESTISAGMYPEYTNGMKSVEHCQRASAGRTFFVTKRGFFVWETRVSRLEMSAPSSLDLMSPSFYEKRGGDT
jgi:hypothetical protein